MAKVKPSFTAFLIPKILPALPKKYSSLLTDKQVAYSRRFARECARRDFGIGMTNLFGKCLSIWLVDHLGIKGLPVHYAARKKYIRDKLDLVIGEIAQVVMVGAGFDTLCLEYAERFPGLKFFELDQAPTQSVKLAALVLVPDNLKFIACDLSRESLREVLGRGGFDTAAKSFFVIEGVLPYLERADVVKLLGEINSGSYLVFGSMAKLVTKNDVRAKLSDVTLAARKEKYKFAAAPEEIEQMLNMAGFKLLDKKLYHELQQGFQSDKQINALKKQRGEHYYLALKN